MANNTELTPHEILGLREILSFEVVGMKKIQASLAIVKDDNLKGFMKKCLDNKKEKISAMQAFIENNANIE